MVTDRYRYAKGECKYGMSYISMQTVNAVLDSLYIIM